MNKLRLNTLAAVIMAAGLLGGAYSISSGNGPMDVFVGQAAAQAVKPADIKLVDLEKALPAEVFKNVRASKVYVNPDELPRFGYSNAVVVNNWTRPLQMNPVVGVDSTRDLTPHLKSALDRMEQAMKDINVTKEALLTLDIYYETSGNSFDKLVAISTVLNEYTASRMAYETNPHRLNALPVRNIYGVRDVAAHLGLNGVSGAKVALVPTVLDPATTTDARLFDIKSPPARTDGRATFLVGGLSSQSLDFSIPSEEQPNELLKNLDIVLRDVGATRSDIDTIHIVYAETCGIAAEQIRPVIDEYFASSGSAPRVIWDSVEVAGFAANCTCAVVEGSIAL